MAGRLASKDKINKLPITLKLEFDNKLHYNKE